MDLATLLGILGAFAIVVLAILFGGDTSPLIFLNIPSILIVVLGSLMVVLIKFTFAQCIGAFKVAAKAFSDKKETSEHLIEQIVDIAKIAKKDGLLAVEDDMITYDFLKQGMQMLVDGQKPEVIKETLSKEIDQTIQRHTWGAKVFSALGDVAPAMGMIGTLIGLVQMLSNMEDPQSIGPAMAVALLTTLYGSMLANMFALPIADKLGLRKVQERYLKTLCMDGILAIEAGYNPRIIEGLLTVYLSPKQKLAQEQKKENADAEAAAAPAAEAG